MLYKSLVRCPVNNKHKMADREYTLRDIDDYDSQYVWIDWFTTEELPALARIDCTWTWHDQGWGNLKGWIHV